MPWHDREGGNGGSWGEQGAKVEDLFKRMGEGFRGKGPNPLWIILILAFLWIAITSIYKVEVEEVGVVQRFGQYVRTTEPGLHIKLPAGIEKVTKVPVRRIITEEFGLRTVQPGISTTYAPERQYVSESLMLTGDLNVALVPWIVQTRIDDAYKYLFKVRRVRETLRDLSEAVVRQVVGDRSINEVLTRRQVIADEARGRLQEALDEAETGLRLVNLELKTTNVPEPVQPAFNDVNKATQEKQQKIRAAQKQQGKIIPAARGKAEKLVQEAFGYQTERVNRAKGDTARFEALWEQYRIAPEVTRQRIYLETLAEVLPNIGQKIVLDQDQKGILPLLDLSKGSDMEAPIEQEE